ncbi:hypothetical protein [Sulfolobus polyhedral virus 1]|uniref:Uncharacterized protein n=1 Tax=Sulfolobus polyhedral virus 1 TaxID=1982658 RepID=A0A1W6I166_SPV1|nr:hypothetical protein DT302_gp28 [Sulfolobus polyhedral virus 1]ARM37810.1 hypothetical protein [Sulfolobus polyhedral virus 1]
MVPLSSPYSIRGKVAINDKGVESLSSSAELRANAHHHLTDLEPFSSPTSVTTIFLNANDNNYLC